MPYLLFVLREKKNLNSLKLGIPAYKYSGMVRPDFDYGTLWYPEIPIPTLILADAVCFHIFHNTLNVQKSPLTSLYVGYSSVLVNSAYILTVYLFWKTKKEMKKKIVTKQVFSQRTILLQKQFNSVLTVQVSAFKLPQNNL
jgi:hypothetical protein